MSESDVAIVGSGPVGTALACRLVARGLRVAVFERGPDVPYPHAPQMAARILHDYDDPRFKAAPDLQGSTLSGDYHFPLEAERSMVVGGCGTHWEGLALRMQPGDFRTRSRYGYGADWAVDYPTLEPWYCEAEDWLSISGTDADNPFAPPRSRPFPLPEFALAWDDVLLAERLRARGIVLHTTPQARTRRARDGRPACQNFGVCPVCPIGARYSPNPQLARAVASGRCTLHAESQVRRVVPAPPGGRPTLVVRGLGEAGDREHAARAVVVAGGAIESTRLLLLSADAAHPDGLGGNAGRLGRRFAFHLNWWNDLRYREPLFPGRFGGWTGQSLQFLDAESRGRHGALKVEFSSRQVEGAPLAWGDREAVDAQLAGRVHQRPIVLVGEPEVSDRNRVTLSTRRDRFGDPFAHVDFTLGDFDLATWAYAREVHDRFVEATAAEPTELSRDPRRFGSGAHHMGGCSMGETAEQGVVDSFGELFEAPGVFVAGGAIFVGPSGAVNPTLTMVALALRSAERIAARVAGG